MNICEDEEAAIYVCLFVRLVRKAAFSVFSGLRCTPNATLKTEMTLEMCMTINVDIVFKKQTEFIKLHKALV